VRLASAEGDLERVLERCRKLEADLATAVEGRERLKKSMVRLLLSLGWPWYDTLLFFAAPF